MVRKHGWILMVGACAALVMTSCSKAPADGKSAPKSAPKSGGDKSLSPGGESPEKPPTK